MADGGKLSGWSIAAQAYACRFASRLLPLQHEGKWQVSPKQLQPLA
jgi:hypothetical protein